MFLKEIQTRPAEGMMKIAFGKLHESGHAVPDIMHLFRFKKRNTDHLVRFTEEVMRGPSPLSWGMRELIGAYVSKKNQCFFCNGAHTPVAAQHLGKELVDEVLLDPETASLDSAHKELFRYIDKLAENPALVTRTDIEKLKEAGWSEEAIFDALTVVSVFKFYNTWNNGSGVRNMSPADHAHSGSRLIHLGYCMDFSFIGIIKVMWLGRKEVNYNDLKGLLKIGVSKLLRWIGAPLLPGKASPESVGSVPTNSPPAASALTCQVPLQPG